MPSTVFQKSASGLPLVREHLQARIAQSLIEPVAPPAPPLPPPVEVPAPLDLLEAPCRQAQARLTAYFGPGAAGVVRPLRDAHAGAAFNAALDDLESRFATHMGRKDAAREQQGRRRPPP
ncbi:hypothetical protein [Cupriavidus sp. UYPR2.512]|uniref:hypothetical protein n=1 Tax=Cupriavidus sp. UYPR2.512 TaxID=1080187 RepID=UPI000378311E|nr:hypothetical protein [Cupriavidus sp. UYPR2.512]UIF88142.1 hypothetical protein KAF44_19815 [Cupriavidus necator]